MGQVKLRVTVCLRKEMDTKKLSTGGQAGWTRGVCVGSTQLSREVLYDPILPNLKRIHPSSHMRSADYLGRRTGGQACHLGVSAS